MGLFADDDLQDARLDALEEHVRRLTDMVQRNQLDLIDAQIAALALQAQIDEKVSTDEVDPLAENLVDAPQCSPRLFTTWPWKP